MKMQDHVYKQMQSNKIKCEGKIMKTLNTWSFWLIGLLSQWTYLIINDKWLIGLSFERPYLMEGLNLMRPK